MRNQNLNYDELITSWNDTLGVIAELTEVPVALVMKVDRNIISVFGKNNDINNPYNVDENIPLEGSGLYCEHVIKNQTLLHVTNALTDPDWDKNPDLQLNMISYLGLPIIDVDNSPFGTICILDTKERKFSEVTIKLLDSIKQSFEAQIKQLNFQYQQNEQKNYIDLLQLTAGVSHEINTPLGVGITVASHIELELENLLERLETKSLSKNQLDRSLLTLQKSSQLLTRNLNSVAQKVNDFKEIAINEFSGNIVQCDLPLVIKETMDQHQLKEQRIQYELDTLHYEGKKIETIPNLIRQCLNILLNNSLIHGFTHVESPKIIVKLITENTSVQIHYLDNGVGIDKEQQKKAFTPFFTTNRASGCTGLGLSVMKRIVIQQLQGQVNMLSPSIGMHLVITIPEK